MRSLGFTLVLLVPAAAVADTPAPTGTWRGTSLCTVRPSSCNDEKVVYHVAAAAKGGPSALAVQANKIVDGKELEMGTLDCTWNGAKRTVTCAIPKGVFRFQVDGARMIGTLELTDGTLFRKIEVTR